MISKPEMFRDNFPLTSFHMLICGIYVEEHGCTICNSCGLPMGPWCGRRSRLLSFSNNSDSLSDYETMSEGDYAVDNDSWYEETTMDESLGDSKVCDFLI